MGHRILADLSMFATAIVAVVCVRAWLKATLYHCKKKIGANAKRINHKVDDNHTIKLRKSANMVVTINGNTFMNFSLISFKAEAS